MWTRHALRPPLRLAGFSLATLPIPIGRYTLVPGSGTFGFHEDGFRIDDQPAGEFASCYGVNLAVPDWWVNLAVLDWLVGWGGWGKPRSAPQSGGPVRGSRNEDEAVA